MPIFGDEQRCCRPHGRVALSRKAENNEGYNKISFGDEWYLRTQGYSKRQKLKIARSHINKGLLTKIVKHETGYNLR